MGLQHSVNMSTRAPAASPPTHEPGRPLPSLAFLNIAAPSAPVVLSDTRSATTVDADTVDGSLSNEVVLSGSKALPATAPTAGLRLAETNGGIPPSLSQFFLDYPSLKYEFFDTDSNGHPNAEKKWHIWPHKPWYQIHFHTGASHSDWYRRPSQEGRSTHLLDVRAAPVFMPIEGYEFDPDSIDERTEQQVRYPKGDCPGLMRKLVFRWMAKPVGVAKQGATTGDVPDDEDVDRNAVDGVKLPWLANDLQRQAYRSSTSGTNQPPQCYMYELSDDYRNFTGPFAPDPDMIEQHNWEDQKYGTPAAPLQGVDVSSASGPDGVLKLFLQKGWRTPRTLHEATMWHLDTRHGFQDSNPGCQRKRVFINPSRYAPQGVARSQRVWIRAKKALSIATSNEISIAQNLKFRYQAWATMPPPRRTGIPPGAMRSTSQVERDTKVLMVDISSHLAHSSDWKLFGGADGGGIRPAFEQRDARKLQVHTLKGGIDLEKLTPTQKGVYDAFIQQLRDTLASGGENVAEEVDKLTRTPSDGYDVDPLLGLMEVPEARDRARSSIKLRRAKGEFVDANTVERTRQVEELKAIRKFLENERPPMPETLDTLIWRAEGINNIQDPGTVRTVSREGDEALNTWYEDTRQDTTTKKIPNKIAVTPTEAAKWPLLRRDINKDATFKGKDTGVDLFEISYDEGTEPRLLAPDEVSPEKIKVVTFATMQSCVPTLDWEAELNAENITPEVLNRYNRWFYGGSDGNGGVPCFWKLSNLENPQAESTSRQIKYSTGVASLFNADATAPFVDAGNMKAGFDGQSVSEWGRVPRTTFFDDRVMSFVREMVTDPGLKDWPHIQPLNADNTRRRIHNNCYIIPYALYNAEAYKDAADSDDAEQERRKVRAAAEEAVAKRAAQVQEDARLALEAAKQAAAIATREAENEAAQKKRELEEADRERLKEAAKAKLEQAGWALVQKWHQKRTVNHNGLDGDEEFPGWFKGDEYHGTLIRDYTDVVWWEAYKKGENVPRPYPLPSNTDDFDGLNGEHGIRWENPQAYEQRLAGWKDMSTDKYSRLPWEPERHEAAYDLYVRGALARSSDTLITQQLRSQLGRKLKGTRPLEAVFGAASFQQRKLRWNNEKKDADKKQERERAADAALAAEKEKVEDPRGEKRGSPDDDSPGAKVRRVLEGDKPPSDDEDDAAADAEFVDEFAPSQGSEGSRPPEGRLDAAMDSVQWKVLGGMTLGWDGSDDRLRLTVANLSRQGFQALWTDATLVERRAMLLLRRAGNNLMKKQTERLANVAIE